MSDRRLEKMKSGSRKKFPKPVKIKKEKNDEEYCPPSLKFYLDDRLEMVKQIFGSLKPKTILNLTPAYLKDKTMEEIQESCLDELLRISTKRLQSIIDGTECPSDTESSCDDSDVQHQEEHISLEEISSDSEIEDKSKPLMNGGIKVQDNDANKSSEEKTGKNQISVLELLELQARARAIRSQLALEPITKIEVESDNENEINRKAQNFSNRSSLERDQQSKNNRGDSVKSVNLLSDKESFGKPNWSENTLPKSKVNALNLPDLSNNIAVENNNINEETLLSKKNDTNGQNADVTDKEDAMKVEQNRFRTSCSPDVISIVIQPETLLISDASDNDEKNPCNDNKVSNTNIEDVSTLEQNAGKCRQKKKKRNVDSEPEEGELIETDDSDEEIESDKPAEIVTEEIDRKEKEIINETEKPFSKVFSDQDSTEIEAVQNISDDINNAVCEDDKSNMITSAAENGDCDVDKSGEENFGTEQLRNNEIEKDLLEESKEKLVENDTKSIDNILDAEEKVDYKKIEIEGEDDASDDVISIEGGDLENEITNQLQNEITSQLHNRISDNSFSKLNTKIDNNSTVAEKHATNENQSREDIIFLESSDDERSKDNESWHARYIKSSKMDKVLATSRLTKRVRDKIKKSKHTIPKKSDQISSENFSEKVFISKHEDGSMEQYRELLDISRSS